ncbi:MAG: FMN-binding protein [Gammaproteobacteria bacterium]|nr:FMN-binding protein [Gammaproteobacteria bacterium]
MSQSPMPQKGLLAVILAGFMLISHAVTAEMASQHHFELPSESYVQNAFDGVTPVTKRVWIRGVLKQQIESILQHKTSILRVKYWQVGDRSVWILDEIGKDKLITTGLTLSYRAGVSSIVNIKVLAYRESRGWEVKYSFFTDQFVGAQLKPEKIKLNKTIDGITGATLSVRALTKVAQIALLLDQHVRKEK